MDALSELQGLSDTADEIIRKGKDHSKGLAEWFELVKQAALSITNDDIINRKASTSRRKSTKKKASTLPDIMSFVTEVEAAPRKKQRISSTLAHMQKDRITHSKRRTSQRNTIDLDASASSSSKQGAAVLDGTFVKQTPCLLHGVETPMTGSSTQPALSVAEAERTFDVSGEVFQTPDMQLPAVGAAKGGVKRKSSSPLPFDITSVKKAKVTTQGPSVVKKSLRKSLRGKVSGNKFFKHRVPSTKISVSGVNTSVLKENRRPKMKTEEENPTLKKVLAARQTKVQEAKRKREEKMQKTSQQRLKLEKEKGERLRCGKHKEVEKPLLKTVLQSQKKRAQEKEKNHNSEVEPERPSTRATKNSAKAIYSTTPAKTLQKKITRSGEETTKNEKEDLNRTYATKPFSSDSDAKPSTSKAPIPRTPMRSPRKIDTKKAVEEANKKEDLKKTFTTKSSSPDSKSKEIKDKKVVSPSKGKFTKTPVPISSSNLTLNGSSNILKASAAPRTPLTSQENNNISQQPSMLKSYEMTPHRDSYVNYDISEIKSDDSDGEDSPPNKKPVPGWATGHRLRNALIQQQYRPIDTDMLFGNVFNAILLHDVMGVQHKRYCKRTSSAIWNSPSAFQ